MTPSRSGATRAATLVFLLPVLTACEDPGEPFQPTASLCGTVSPPVLLGEADRVLTDVVLEVQLKGIVMKVTVEDPNGPSEFASVMQQMEVFQDNACRTATLEARNQISAVGTPISFGTIVRAEFYPDLYQEIAAAHGWPVRVHFVDNDGNAVAARIRARVVDRTGS